jgi:hypothetical protein
VLNRIRFYILLLGGFLAIEIPLFIFTYFKYFSQYRNLVWIFTLLIGIASAFVVFYLINSMIRENYEIKLLFDNTNYNSLFNAGPVREEAQHEKV